MAGQFTEGQLGTSLTLFRVSGIEVKVHWSFVLILIWGAVVYGATGQGLLAGALYGVAVILLLFVCVTLHEFGHAYVAKYYGINVPTITLLPIGGVAQLERSPEKPSQELWIAVAGPAVNIVLAALLIPLALLFNGAGGAGGLGLNPNAWLGQVMQPGLGNLLAYLAAVNLLLALFNMLPAFPMDGGRVLRALLALNMPYVRATRVAVTVGRLLAIPLAIWGIVGGNILLLLIAFFVYVGGGAEREAVESRSVLGKVKVSSALAGDTQRLYTSETLQRAMDLIMTSYQADYPVFDLGNKFVGVLTRPRLVEALRTQGSEARVVEAMIPADRAPTVAPTATLADVWEVMATSGAHVVVVRDGSEFLGLLNSDDITEVVHVFGAALERNPNHPPFPPAPHLRGEQPPAAAGANPAEHV
jgi:stage IV sporulation protein FB